MTTSPYSVPSVNFLRFEPDDPGHPLPPVQPLEELLAAAAAAGFTQVGLDDLTLGGYVRDGGSLDGVPKLVHSHGLALSDLGVLRIGEPDVLDVARTLASLAAATGAGVCMTALYTEIDDGAVAQLRTCGDILGEAGTRLALEHGAYGYLRTLAHSVALCEAVGWERCGVLADSWHFFRGESDWRLLRSLRERQIAHVHVNDGAAEPALDPVIDSRFRRLPPGTGTFPLDEFRAAIEASGYDGAISAEVLSAELRKLDAGEAARTLMAGLRRAWPL
jgi:sugar phosphate isomerase/epimerase